MGYDQSKLTSRARTFLIVTGFAASFFLGALVAATFPSFAKHINSLAAKFCDVLTAICAIIKPCYLLFIGVYIFGRAVYMRYKHSQSNIDFARYYLSLFCKGVALSIAFYGLLSLFVYYRR